MKTKWKVKWKGLGILVCVLCAAFLFAAHPVAAEGAKRYVVTARITPLFETVKAVKAAFGGG